MSAKEPVSGQATKSRLGKGRPPKLTDKQLKVVYDAFERYIDEEEDPSVVGFVAMDKTAVKYRVTRENIKDWSDFSPLVRRAIAKQEFYLTHGAASGKVNATMAIFRLKQPQHGFRDKIETDITSGGEKLAIGITSEQSEQLIRIRAERSNL